MKLRFANDAEYEDFLTGVKARLAAQETRRVLRVGCPHDDRGVLLAMDIGDVQPARVLPGLEKDHVTRLGLCQRFDEGGRTRDARLFRVREPATGQEADERGGEAGRQDQRSEGHVSPVLRLDASGTDALVPDLGGLLIGRLGLRCLAVMRGGSSKQVHERSLSERLTEEPEPWLSPERTA